MPDDQGLDFTDQAIADFEAQSHRRGVVGLGHCGEQGDLTGLGIGKAQVVGAYSRVSGPHPIAHHLFFFRLLFLLLLLGFLSFFSFRF